MEFDYYLESCGSGKNPFYLYNVYADGTVKKDINGAYTSNKGIDSNGDGTGDTNGVRLQADNVYVPYKTWFRIRMVYDNTNKKIYTFASTDNGATYRQCATVTNYVGDTITQVGLTGKPGFAATMYFDNIVCVKTNAETYGITIS